MKKTVIAIVGPTAVGKTKLSIELAKSIQGEIISGDSMQVYKGMDIGTAKVTENEMQGIPHYMIDLKEPNETFSVADFKNYVQGYINEITAKKKIPIIVGGSGLYIQATLYNYNFSDEKRDDSISNALEIEILKHGITPLYNRLKNIDPDQAKKIHPNNHRRVVRALEIYEKTGKTMSEFQREQMKESPYNIIFIGLEMERELLYNRINKRIELMVENGLVEEAQHLFKEGFKDYQSMKAIGYKEFIPYFEEKQSLDQSIELLKRNSRRYAKRQYTWFKNKLNINWYSINPNTIDKSIETILKDIAGVIKER